MNIKNYIFWLAIAVLAYLFLNEIKPVLLPFIVGILVGYFLDPLADRLEEIGCSRVFATTVITVSFFGIFFVALIFLLPELLEQISQLISVLPGYAVEFYSSYETIMKEKLISMGLTTKDIQNEIILIDKAKIARLIGEFMEDIVFSSLSILSLLSMIIISPVIAFYFLRDWDKMIAKITLFIPRHNFETVKKLAIEIDDTISSFIRGQLTVIFLVAGFYSISLFLAGLDYAFALGFISGLLIILPYVGLVLGLILTCISAYFQFAEMNMVLLVAAIYGAGQLLENAILTPRIIGNKVGLHPVWVLFAILAGGALFGFLGVLIAIPVAAVIGVLVRYMVEQYLTSSVYDSSGTGRKKDKKTKAARTQAKTRN